MRVSGRVRFVTLGAATRLIGESTGRGSSHAQSFLAYSAPTCKSIRGQGDLTKRFCVRQCEGVVVVCLMTEILKPNKSIGNLLQVHHCLRTLARELLLDRSPQACLFGFSPFSAGQIGSPVRAGLSERSSLGPSWLLKHGLF